MIKNLLPIMLISAFIAGPLRASSESLSHRAYLNDIEDEADFSEDKVVIKTVINFSSILVGLVTFLYEDKKIKHLSEKVSVQKYNLNHAQAAYSHVDDMFNEISRLHPNLAKNNPEIIFKLILKAEKANLNDMKAILAQDRSVDLRPQAKQRMGALKRLKEIGEELEALDRSLSQTKIPEVKAGIKAEKQFLLETKDHIQKNYWGHLKNEVTPLLADLKEDRLKALNAAKVALKSGDQKTLTRVQFLNKITYVSMMLAIFEYAAVSIQTIENVEEVDVIPLSGTYEALESLYQFTIEAIEDKESKDGKDL